MTQSDYAITELVTTRPGEPYRLLPFGRLVKGGRARDITPSFARKFSLPHFRPPVKLGSHADPTPAGGHIIGLEVRDDGLYAIPEFNDAGAAAIEAGAYRYHSPEIIWEDGGLENPATGEIIRGPLIVGDALLHMPHLGEAAALYVSEEVHMTDETITVSRSWFERLIDKFSAHPEPPIEQPTPPAEQLSVDVVEIDRFQAVQAERDEFKARLEAIEAQAAKAARVEQFRAALVETKAEPNADMLAGMTDEQAAWVVQQFKALTSQIDESALTKPIGSENEGAAANPMQALDAAIRAKMTEFGITYAAAVQAVDPALVSAVYGGK